jgi:ribosomal protein S20
MKRIKQSVEGKDRQSASTQLKEFNKALGKAVNKGILKSNTASRWLSRLSRSVSRLAT